jgi:hypothetical protein
MKLIGSIFLMAMGCAISVEDFPERAATAVCDKAEQCDDLQGSYTNCVSFWSGAASLWVGLAEAQNYDYSASEAAACVRRIGRVSCDERDNWDFDANCGDIWR